MRKLLVILIAISFQSCIDEETDNQPLIDFQNNEDDSWDEVIGTYVVDNNYGSGELNIYEDHTYTNEFKRNGVDQKYEGKWDLFYNKLKDSYEVLFTKWIWYFPKAIDIDDFINDSTDTETLVFENDCLSFANFVSKEGLGTYCKI
ncbi:MAG: hypothetical protein MK078_15215 [Crocinitomicaceae bacterium]|nr:hypothetical protein [Crocinitomicaceae bacterium]